MVVWKCSTNVLNVVALYVEPKNLVNLFVGCGLDFGMRFMYNGFCYEGLSFREIHEILGVFTGVVLIGLCVKYDYTHIVNSRCDCGCIFRRTKCTCRISSGQLSMDYLVGDMFCKLRYLRFKGGISNVGVQYECLFDSNVLMMFSRIRVLVLENVRLQGLNGLLFCEGMRVVEIVMCEWEKTDISCFAKLENLSVVKFEGCYVIEREAHVLMECRNLRKLEIHNIWPIKVPFAFKNLVYLKVKNYHFVNDTKRYASIKVEDLNMCRKLKKLNLCGWNVGKDDRRLVLRELELRGCKIVHTART